jgi:hypothetical protein
MACNINKKKTKNLYCINAALCILSLRIITIPGNINIMMHFFPLNILDIMECKNEKKKKKYAILLTEFFFIFENVCQTLFEKSHLG